TGDREKQQAQQLPAEACVGHLAYFELLQHVAEAPHGADVHPGALELGPEARNVDLDGVGRKILVPAGDRLDDALLRHDLLHLAEKRESKESIIQAVAGWDEDLSPNAIEVYI